jgi:hypothetical protein
VDRTTSCIATSTGCHVHWFQARSDSAFTLDVVVDNLDPTLGFRYEMDYVDPLGGEPAGSGRVRAAGSLSSRPFRCMGHVDSGLTPRV